MSVRYVLVVLSAILVAGCGHYEWVNRSGPSTDAEFNRSSLSCQQEGARLYPFRSKTIVTEGNYVPAQPTQTNCYNYGGNVQCNTTGGGGGYREAPTYQQVDGNAGNRDEFWRTCMATKGWYKVYVDGSSKSQPAQQVKSKEQIEAETVRNLRDAADRGNARAMNQVGVAYENGQGGLPKDEAVAYSWYSRAANEGDPYGQLNLARYLIQGKAGTPKNFPRGFSMLQKSASQGIPQAQHNLGWCYENGVGTQRNLDEAVRWYRTAAANGYKKADEALQRLGR